MNYKVAKHPDHHYVYKLEGAVQRCSVVYLSADATRLNVPDEAYEGHTISWNLYAIAADERNIVRKSRQYGI
ncbi:hypothetical protein M5K25_023321 [Dendrobium thyrsiflorum]|uniref:Uncharacterized protein n=1 Tax=Dendrobium thyrsiflorum TaxID=117978 RepID=A0ABD0U7V9_DENTH